MDFINIETLFSSLYYSVPDYQRDYEWTSAQNNTLWEDIVELINNKDQKSLHFIGAIVTVPYEKDTGVNQSIQFSDYNISTDKVRHLVDGQQRLTSISLLVAALKDVINEDKQLDENMSGNFRDKLAAILCGNDIRKPTYQKAPRLILNGNTGKFYNKEILKKSEDKADGVLRGARRINDTYRKYKNWIINGLSDYLKNTNSSDNEEYYRLLIDIVINRLTLVEIKCDGSSNAFQVFDSLNGKGLDLTAADRIKNIMMSWAKPTDKAAQKWDALVELTNEKYLVNYFIALFFYTKGIRVSKMKLPEEFKDTYINSAKNNYTSFYETLKETAILYGKIRLCKMGTSSDEERINALLHDLSQLKLDQAYVLIFAVFYHYKDKKVKNEKYIEFLSALISLIVRMQICDLSMNSLDILFKKCISEMKTANGEITWIIQTLIDEKQKKVSDTQFFENFQKFSTEDNTLCEFYLRHIEEYKSFLEKGNRNPMTRTGLTVEHIIPQTLDDIHEWYGDEVIPEEIEKDFKMEVVQNIGNKALLYGDDNTSAGNNNYASKIDVYKNGKMAQTQGTPEGTFLLIRDLLKNYPKKFNHNQVAERAKELAGYAVKIW